MSLFPETAAMYFERISSKVGRFWQYALRLIIAKKKCN
jgi:hypothetical protein